MCSSMSVFVACRFPLKSRYLRALRQLTIWFGRAECQPREPAKQMPGDCDWWHLTGDKDSQHDFRGGQVQVGFSQDWGWVTIVRLQIMAVKTPPPAEWHLGLGQKGQTVDKEYFAGLFLKLNSQFNLLWNGRIVRSMTNNIYNMDLMYF